MKTGWIALHRKIQENFLWKKGRVFSKAEAWIDILMEVQHDTKQDKVMLGSVVVTCDRGQSIKSLETWAMRWTWSRSAVQRFLKLLKQEKMIMTENLVKTIRITVCNYEVYQKKRIKPESDVNRTRTGPDFVPDTDKNSKEIKYNLNAESFLNSYEQKGWMVGKNKMKCWKSAVRNWKANGWGKAVAKPLSIAEKLAEADRRWPPKEKP